MKRPLVALVLSTFAPIICLTLLTQPLVAQDFDEYTALTEAANGILSAIELATDDELEALRLAAVSADQRVIAWLEQFFTTDEFSSLSEGDQSLAYRDRWRWEFNLSVQLVALERCDEAVEHIRPLLNSGHSDEELRPALTDSYEQALLCAAQVNGDEQTIVTIETDPPGATVAVDGVVLGLTPLRVEVSLGRHEITVMRVGYVEVNHTIESEGEPMSVDFELQPEDEDPVVEPARRGPNGLEWALWGVGAIGVGTGIGLLVTSGDRASTIADPPEGFFVTDPNDEQDFIDTLDTAAYISGGLGIAAAIAGLVSYLTRPDEQRDRESAAVWFGAGPSVGLQVGF